MISKRSRDITLLVMFGIVLGIAYTMTNLWVKAENEKEKLLTKNVELQPALVTKNDTPSIVQPAPITLPPLEQEFEITHSEAHELIGNNGEKSRLVEVWRGESHYELYLESANKREELISLRNDIAGFKTVFETKGSYSLLTLWSLSDEPALVGPGYIGHRYLFGFIGDRLSFTTGQGNVAADLVINMDNGSIKNHPLTLVFDGLCDQDGIILFVGVQTDHSFYRNPGNQGVHCEFGYGDSWYEPKIRNMKWDDGKLILELPGELRAAIDPSSPYFLQFLD